jgi:hypothetical protein
MYTNRGMNDFRCARCGTKIEIGDSYFRENEFGYCMDCERPLKNEKSLSLMGELAKITDSECPGEGTRILSDFKKKYA